MENKDRYQYQPLYVKLWRIRYYLQIPYSAIRIYFKERKYGTSWKNCLGIAIGLAQVKMNWTYSWDDFEN